VIDDIFDKWFKKKWFKTRGEKFFFYWFPLEKVYWFELFLIVVSTYLILRGYYFVMAAIYLFRLYLYAMTKFSEKFYPAHIQKYNALIRKSIYNGAEILIFAAFMIQSYNLNEYAIFGIAVMAMMMYFFYQLFDFNGNKKNLMQVRGDYLFIVTIGFLVNRVDYLMLFLIILYGFAIFDFIYKTLNQLRDSADFSKNRETLNYKLTKIQKKYGIVVKSKGEKEKNNSKPKKSKSESVKSKRNNVKSKDISVKSKHSGSKEMKQSKNSEKKQKISRKKTKK